MYLSKLHSVFDICQQNLILEFNEETKWFTQPFLFQQEIREKKFENF